jgi:hypothetical protein
MEKSFVIRQIAYLYDDECLRFHTLGGVKQVFSNEEEAKKALIQLERAAFEKFDLSDLEQFSGCGRRGDMTANVFNQYFQKRFGKEIVKTSQYGAYCERGTYLPKNLKDEDILDIREIGKIKFYELAEFQGKPFFWGIWKHEQYFAKPGWVDYLDAPLFFNSIENALEVATQKLAQIFYLLVIHGNLEELSETPSILRSLIENSSCMNYDGEKKQLTIQYLPDREAQALNEMLRKKVFEIKKIELEEVESISHWVYEQT